MDWKTAVLLFVVIYYADGYSKYGRTCKDIGCLNSEVCVLAEDPCSFGHTTGCGTYPTCKKKSLVEGSHAEPAPAPKPATPKPQIQTNFDSPPNYKPPAPPSDGVSFGGNSPYGNPYGGSSGGSSPYGSPYGGSSGGGSSYGNTNYGGSTNGGHSPYGTNNYGGNSPYGNPYGGSNTGGSTYGSNHGGNPYSSGGSGGKSPIDNIYNTLTNVLGGGGGAAGSGGSGLGNIFGNLLSNFSKNGLGAFGNTRPIMENPNYSSYASNSRSSNPSSYPQNTQEQNRNYKPNYGHSAATTRRPVSYGWNVSVTVVLTYLIHQYIQNIIRT